MAACLGESGLYPSLSPADTESLTGLHRGYSTSLSALVIRSAAGISKSAAWWVVPLAGPTKAQGCGMWLQEVETGSSLGSNDDDCVTRPERKVTVAVMSSRLKEADEVFPLFNFFLDFVTGGRNFRLCGEDGTDKGEDGAPGGGIKGPAQGAVSRFVGGCVPSTVYGFLAAPACRVEDQAEDEEQT